MRTYHAFKKKKKLGRWMSGGWEGVDGICKVQIYVTKSLYVILCWSGCFKQACSVEAGNWTHEREVSWERTQADISPLSAAGGQRSGHRDPHSRCYLFQCSVWCRPHQRGFTGALYLWTSSWQLTSGIHSMFTTTSVGNGPVASLKLDVLVTVVII